MLSEKYTEVELKINAVDKDLESLIKSIETKRTKIKKDLENAFNGMLTTKTSKEELKIFVKEPYVIVPKRSGEWYVIAPKFIDFQIGWLERATESYNIFVVNKYMRWLAKVPEKLKEKFKFKDPLPLKVFDGMVLTGKQHQDEAYKRYSQFLSKREGADRIRIRKGYEFKLMAKMIDDGILPFMPNPVEKIDINPVEIHFELRDYQKKAYDKFLETGAIGTYFPFGSGKTMVGLWALGNIKVGELPSLVIVPTRTLKEQWIIRLNQYIPERKWDVEVETYNAFQKLQNRKFGVIIYDECHRLPANTFSRLATIKAKYRIGLSATPYREDGRTDYIFALTGYPVGLDWTKLIEMNIVKKPRIYLYLLSDRQAKIRKLEELLKLPQKTIIFCDSIDFGERLSKKFEIPFIHGGTSKRLETIENADVSIVSRVGDEGISLPDLERVVEIDFQFGSRRQEGQRMGRLFHADKRGEHIILMTEEEFENYEKRLYAIYEKGFKIEIIR